MRSIGLVVANDPIVDEAFKPCKTNRSAESPLKAQPVNFLKLANATHYSSANPLRLLVFTDASRFNSVFEYFAHRVSTAATAIYRKKSQTF